MEKDSIMWAMNPEKKIAILLLLLLWFGTTLTRAQQALPAGQDTGKDLAEKNAAKQTGQSQAQRVAVPVDKNLSSDDSAPPAIPGAQTRVLKEGEKIPERNNPEYEDWSKPELTPGMRTEVVPLGRIQEDGFIRELVSVQWREFDPINLWIVRPASVKMPAVILYLYSYPASNDRYQNREFCQLLVRDGFAAVGFVSALTEQRFHDRARIQTFVSELQESLGATVHDVQMILNYLATRGDLDMNRVGIWGDGSGASIAIMAAAVDPRIKALDLLNPWGDWPAWLAKSSLVPEKDRAQYLTPSFLQSVENLDPLTWFPRLKTARVRLQYIANGITVTPAEVREKMETAAPPNAEIVHYENTKAFVSDVASKGIGFQWIKERLRMPPSSQNEAENKAETSLQR